MDLFLALELIALALSGLLIWHSARTRGAAFTWMFFVGGAFLGLIRENVVAQVAALNLYSYSPATFHLWVGAAPLILTVFWSYAIFLARKSIHIGPSNHQWPKSSASYGAMIIGFLSMWWDRCSICFSLLNMKFPA